MLNNFGREGLSSNNGSEQTDPKNQKTKGITDFKTWNTIMKGASDTPSASNTNDHLKRSARNPLERSYSEPLIGINNSGNETPGLAERYIESIINSPWVPDIIKQSVSKLSQPPNVDIPQTPNQKTVKHSEPSIPQNIRSNRHTRNISEISSKSKQSDSPKSPSKIYKRSDSYGSFSERSSLFSMRSIESRSSVSSSVYEKSLDDMLDENAAAKLKQFQDGVITDLYHVEASKILSIAEMTKNADQGLLTQIQVKRRELKQANPAMDDSQLEKDPDIMELQKERDQLVIELTKHADSLQEKMERNFGEEMEIIQDSKFSTEREEREDGVMFKFGDDANNANFQMDVQEWINRKLKNLNGALDLNLETRLRIKYQSQTQDTYARAQEYAKWHLTLIKYLKNGDHTKYKDFSTRPPTIKCHTGEQAEKTRIAVLDAIDRNARYLASLMQNHINNLKDVT